MSQVGSHDRPGHDEDQVDEHQTRRQAGAPPRTCAIPALRCRIEPYLLKAAPAAPLARHQRRPLALGGPAAARRATAARLADKYGSFCIQARKRAAGRSFPVGPSSQRPDARPVRATWLPAGRAALRCRAIGHLGDDRRRCKAPPPDCRQIVVRLRYGVKGGCDRWATSLGNSAWSTYLPEGAVRCQAGFDLQFRACRAVCGAW